MQSEIFEDIYKSYQNDFDDGRKYKDFAELYGYSSSEAIRSAFRRERRNRGLPSKNMKESEFPSKEKIEVSIQKKKSKCKILFYDVEATPLLALTFSCYQTNISSNAILQDWHLVCWSASWLLEDGIMSDVLTVKEAEEHDDYRIVKSLWSLLDEADACVGHNIEGFDNRRMNTRFLYHGLPPVSKYQSIDTLKIARETFDFSSRKLDYINQFLGIPQKSSTTFDLWKRVFLADPLALKEMLDYNIMDVKILPELFFKLRPYMKNLVNLNLWNEENLSVCPNCGSDKLTWKKMEYTYTQRYDAFRCDDCGAIGRSKVSNLSKEKRKSIVR